MYAIIMWNPTGEWTVEFVGNDKQSVLDMLIEFKENHPEGNYYPMVQMKSKNKEDDEEDEAYLAALANEDPDMDEEE